MPKALPLWYGLFWTVCPCPGWLYRLDTSWSDLRKGNHDWEPTSLGLACRHACAAFSSLVTGQAGPRPWEVWPWVVKGSRLNKPWGSSQVRACILGFCFSYGLQVPGWISHPAFLTVPWEWKAERNPVLPRLLLVMVCCHSNRNPN